MKKIQYKYTLALLISLSFQAKNLSAQVVGSNFLDINNVKATVNADGNLFNNNSTYQPGFEVPIGSNKHTIYTSGLWIGGYDAGGALHTACQTYKQIGNDFVYGPTPVNPTIFNNMNKVWKVNRAAIDDFKANQGIPNYIIPQEIIDWPGNYGTAIYAPFYDLNNNGLYEPLFGDYPAIKGDQALYFVFNDATTHSESNGLAMNVEIHGMAYAFTNPIFPELNNTIFVEQRIKNKSSSSYDSCYVSMWNDFDLGNPYDDFIGTDVLNNMLFAYNSDSIDEGPIGYGANPPAMSMTFLNKPLSFGMAYKNDFSNFGNPSATQHYYNYQQSRLKNGTPLYYSNSTNPCSYIFPGSSDSAFAGQLWAQNAADGFDWRMLGSYGPFALQPGDVISLEVAYIYHQDNVNSLDGLRIASQSIKNLYDSGVIGINSISNTSPLTIKIFPNPMTDKTSIAFNNNAHENFSLTLFDTYGKIALEKNNITENFVELDRTNLSQGLYYLMLRSGDKSISAKITVK